MHNKVGQQVDKDENSKTFFKPVLKLMNPLGTSVKFFCCQLLSNIDIFVNKRLYEIIVLLFNVNST